MNRARRSLLWGAASVCALAAVPVSALAEDAPPPALPFKLVDLGHGVHAAIDVGGKAGANAGFVIGDDGVLVVDSFYSPDAAPALLAEIRKLTPLPIRYVVNTHYHIDHVSGNAIYRAAGAQVVAQRNVAQWIHTENPKFYGDKITQAQKDAIAAIPAPTVLVDKKMTLHLGKRAIEVVERPGHTGGDVTVFIPDAKVMFCGDLVWNQIPPNLIDATVAKWVPTLEAIVHAPHAADIAYVPGHGEMASVADVAAFQLYLETVRAETKAGLAQGLSGDALAKAVMAKMAPRYGSWSRFERAIPREVGFMVQELDGTKKWPQPQTAS
jgi:glyoxylase-like metal-dependent hydrolase (beta-lactamase superfamily II)